MNKKRIFFAGLGLLACSILIAVFFTSNHAWRSPDETDEMPTQAGVSPSPALPQPQTSPEASTDGLDQVTASPPTYVQPAVQTQEYTQMIDSTEVTLTLNWFYIDQTRIYIEATLCNFPLPADFKPINLIDRDNLAVYGSDKSVIAISQRNNIGGGAGGEEEPPAEINPSCREEILDYLLEGTQPFLSPEDTYTLDIPVGGDVYGEDGNIRSIAATVFHIEARPTFTEPLTFTLQKSAVVEGKTITFKTAEVNPTGAAVVLCVFDPQGEQWLPSVNLVYKGDILYAFNGGLVDGSTSDTHQEMCYRLNYSYLFHFDSDGELKSNLTILFVKLTRDQPERLPYAVISRAQNKLAAEGLEFDYIVGNHTSGINITNKPAGMTELEALSKIQDALLEGAITSEVIVFDLDG